MGSTFLSQPDWAGADALVAEEGLVGSQRWTPFLLILGVAAAIFTLRLAAPPNLIDQDQQRPAAYVLDVIKNGNWLCQRDLSGAITSKPPLYTWLCALCSLAFGRINLAALYLPGALAAFGTAWLIYLVGRPQFGSRAAWLGALACMLTSAGFKESGLARTDGVFAFTVTAAAMLAYRAWNLGRGWSWFWLMSGGATLTKGPLGLILAVTGLLACLWERRSTAVRKTNSAEQQPQAPVANPPSCFIGAQLAGLGLFLVITLGWIALAYVKYGLAVPNKLIFEEFVGQATGTTVHHIPGTLFWQQPLYYLGRAAPWSLLAYFGLWRIWRCPAINDRQRRFERFLFCWFVGGLTLFSLAPHQRADHLWPLMPAAALIAGRELDRLGQRWTSRAFGRALCLFIVLEFAGFAFYYFGPHAHTAPVRQTVALKNLAAEIERLGGREFPLTHVADPMALQVYLDTLRPAISHEQAARLLRGPEPAYVAVDDLGKLQAAQKPDDPTIYTVLKTPENAGYPATYIVSNRRELSSTDSAGFYFGLLSCRMNGAQLLEATEQGFCFAQSEQPGRVIIKNEYPGAHRISVCIQSRTGRVRSARTLQSGESWDLTFEAKK